MVLFLKDAKDYQRIEPEDPTYIRSLSEYFDEEMELKKERIKNWLEYFGFYTKERKWYQVHVSGHGVQNQIKKVVKETKYKKLFPIHTEHEDYHKKWHSNVKLVNQSDSVRLLHVFSRI